MNIATARNGRYTLGAQAAQIEAIAARQSVGCRETANVGIVIPVGEKQWQSIRAVSESVWVE